MIVILQVNAVIVTKSFPAKIEDKIQNHKLNTVVFIQRAGRCLGVAKNKLINDRIDKIYSEKKEVENV